MSRRHSVYQIVEVIAPGRVRDVHACEWPYGRRDGRMLVNGYYVVSWKTVPQSGRFNEDATFSGPFPRRQSALDALHSIFAPRPAFVRPAAERSPLAMA